MKRIPLRESSVFAVFAAVLAVLAFRAPDFFGSAQLRSLAVGLAPVLLAGIGMTLVVITRQIDISVGSQFCIGGIVAGLLAKSGAGLPFVIVGTLLTGAALGTVNALLVVRLKLPSIVVTLATLVIYREGLRWFRSGAKVNDLPSSFQWFGCGIDTGSGVIVGI